MVRSNAQLREVLFQELDDLMASKVSPQHARSVAAVAKQILSSARLDLDYRVISGSLESGKLPDLPALQLTQSNVQQ